MSEVSILSDFERICRVLAILHDNPEFAPYYSEYSEELNPTMDKMKTRVLTIERAWDWRDRVYNSFRCSLPQCCNQMAKFAAKSQIQMTFCQRFDPSVSHGWIPFQRHHCWAWWSFYWHGKYSKPVDRAISIIVKNFDRWRVWEETSQ